ncbi:hypothetical protein EV356DRAFT_507339 [Viridothelium virens]|uniref:WW domain-containing protein n=1 Tax=Viridothelium virens TaxID=1048519 RepID=A0A6A6HKA4_VIRVR|nr:hypothetical protein EV356DRAFT_507339 [Viridothelium virens]
MADYLPPTGPPPPKVPPGWKAQYNEQYQEWFYVNLYTKKSQWDRPTEPAHDDSGSSAAPPPYAPGQSTPLGPEKGSLSSNNPYGSSSSAESDEAMARRLQAEEDARSHGRPLSRGAADSYYSQSGPPAGYAPSPHQSANYDQDLPPRPEGKKGFLGKILGKSSSSSHPQQGYPPQQQQYYQGPPQGQYGYQPQQGYYGQGGYPPQQQYMQQQQAQRRHGGLGTGGALALGGGAGLLGGLALGEAMDGGDGGDGGGDDGGDFGGDGGGDFGGGDF